MIVQHAFIQSSSLPTNGYGNCAASKQFSVLYIIIGARLLFVFRYLPIRPSNSAVIYYALLSANIAHVVNITIPPFKPKTRNAICIDEQNIYNEPQHLNGETRDDYVHIASICSRWRSTRVAMICCSISMPSCAWRSSIVISSIVVLLISST